MAEKNKAEKNKIVCYVCGKELEKISYVMPSYRPHIPDHEYRPPLCKECHEKELEKRR